MAEYLITKKFDPTGSYARSLQRLPGEEEPLLQSRDAFIALRHVPDEFAEEQVRELRSRNRPHIQSVELDLTASIPTPVQSRSAERLTTDEILELLGVDRLHQQGIKGRGAKAAVIDTGCGTAYMNHLGDKIFHRSSVVPGEGPESSDDTHGEWCLSMIHSIAPDAQYAVIKALSDKDGSGRYSWIISAVQRALEIGCDVISLSLGGPASSAMDASVDAADGKGAIVAVAAGNEQRGSNRYVADETSPARAKGGLTVAAASSDLTIADFSNWGTCVDLSALGNLVEAQHVLGFWRGTSMSTPEVAAIAVLLRSAGYYKSRVKQEILASAQDTPASAVQEGQGFVQADLAYRKLVGEAPPEDTGARIGKTRFAMSSARKIDAMGDNVVITVRGDDWRITRRV